MKLILWLRVILTGLLACQSSNQTSLTHEQQQLIHVYADMLLIQQSLSPANPTYADSCKNVLEKHGFSESLYLKTLQSLNRQPERWEVFYQAVLAEMDRQNQLLRPQNSE